MSQLPVTWKQLLLHFRWPAGLTCAPVDDLLKGRIWVRVHNFSAFFSSNLFDTKAIFPDNLNLEQRDIGLISLSKVSLASIMPYSVRQCGEQELSYCFPFLAFPHDLCFSLRWVTLWMCFDRNSVFHYCVHFLCSSQRSHISTLFPTACLFKSQRFLKAKIGKRIEKIGLQFHSSIFCGGHLYRMGSF